MSTWAARLSTGSKTPAASASNSPYAGCGDATPLPEMELVSIGPSAVQVEADEQAELLEVVRRAAEEHNESVAKVCTLPADCWDWLTAFLSFRDVLSLMGTCRGLHHRLLHRDSIWQQQLHYLHEAMVEMQAGTLLLMDFVVPQEVDANAYERFMLEQRLYALDCRRSFHLQDVSTLEDVAVGIFTVPLHYGFETLRSTANAPISRPHFVDPLGDTSPPPRLPLVGMPVLRREVPEEAQPLVLLQLERGEQQPQPTSSLRSDVDVDEELMLSYVLAVSAAEAEGRSPPPPPWGGGTRSSNRAASQPSTSQVQMEELRLSELMTIVDFIHHGTRQQSRREIIDATAAEDPNFLRALTETVRGARRRRLHLGNHHLAVGNNGQTRRYRSGRPPVTASTSPAISSVPSVAEFGAITPSPSHSNIMSGLSPPSMEADTNTNTSNTPPTQQQQQQQQPASAAAATLPLNAPRVNRILLGFRGVLLEISRCEAYKICEIVGKPDVLDDFVLDQRLRPMDLRQPARAWGKPLTTRYFLAPDLCHDGFVGLFVVDAVRLFVLVEKERVERDDAAWDESRVAIMGGRLMRQGEGYNAQV